MTKPRVRIVPLGGVGEIGKNMMAVECGDHVWMVDAGVKFPEEELRGIDLLIPDATYLVEHPAVLEALLLTHGHEDHIGAIPFILPDLASADDPLPIVGGPLSVGFTRAKLEELGIANLATLTSVEPNVPYEWGPVEVEFVRVSHSIPDSMAIVIRTPVGTFVTTGDFKFDVEGPPEQRTDVDRLRQIGDEGVHVLLSDSTRVDHLGRTPSERLVTETLDKIVAAAPGRVIISSFASNIARLGDVMRAASRLGRCIALVGRSLDGNARVARELGYLPEEATILPLEEVLQLPMNRQMLLTAGSQGEPTAALTRMAAGMHRRVHVGPEDTVVLSASPVPGNEETVSRTIDALFKRGARVIYPAIEPGVHVSGHGGREELKEMLQLLRPRFVVPIHGEYRHFILFRDLCREIGIDDSRVIIPHLGEPLEFDGETVTRGKPVVAGSLLVDRLEVNRKEYVRVRGRDELTDEGMVLASVVVDRERGCLVGVPLLAARNFPGNGSLEAAARAVEREFLRSDPLPAYGELVERTKEAVGRAIYKATKRRPFIVPVVTEV